MESVEYSEQAVGEEGQHKVIHLRLNYLTIMPKIFYHTGGAAHLPASCFHKCSNGKGKADINPTVDRDQVQVGEEASEGQG